MTTPYSKTIITEETYINARIWEKVKKVLDKKGARAAQEMLAAIRAEQALNAKGRAAC